MSSTPVIEVENLHRSFGAVQAVRGVSFRLERGQVAGFIGANGAGKTTTMRILATLDLANHGQVRVAGYDVLEHPARVRNVLGWMPDHFGAYPSMDVQEYLDFFARAMGLRGKARTKRVTEVMDFTELHPLKTRPSDRLSKGQTQRLCLARTLLNDPQVLILDEPAAGLDPKARLEFKNLVRILAGQGKSMLISSHILTELAEMCDTMLFIDQGQIVHHGSADSLRFDDTGVLSVCVRVSGPVEALLDWAKLQSGLRLREEVRAGAIFDLEGRGEEVLRDFLRQLIADGLPVIEFQRERQALEAAFIGILRQQGGARPRPRYEPPASAKSTNHKN
jgi:ABC-2 type transport system ATP-binding protein